MSGFINCFVVDDDQDDQEIFNMAVEDLGFTCTCNFADNPVDALERLGKMQPLPDFIFLDLNMPMLNGIQTLQEIKNKPEISGIPVIICSTSSEEFYRQEANNYGAHAFITKPSSITELTRILKDIFTGDIQ